MAWFKVDDGLHSSRKLMSIPKRTRWAAVGLWAVAGSWCADQLTDGHVPDYMLAEWGAPPSAPQALVDSGLWERESSGYLFRNWHEYQPSKRDVDAERAASRERMRELRARRKQKKPQEQAADGELFGRTGANGSENVRNPDPTRPDPLTTSDEVVTPLTPQRGKRGTRIDTDWKPSAETVEKIEHDCPGLDYRSEHPVFIDYWIAQPGQKGVKLDWDATWRNWMRRKYGDGPKRGPQQKLSVRERNLAFVAGLGSEQKGIGQ